MGDSANMAAKLSLIVLTILGALLFTQARRGGYRTEEDRRETRRKLLEQRDPRRAGWSPGRSGEDLEGRRQSVRISRKPVAETLSYQDTRIFRDLIQKKINDEKEDITEDTTEQIVEIKDMFESLDDNQEITTEHFVSQQIDKEFTQNDEFDTNLEEGSGEISETSTEQAHTEATVILVNGRKAVIRKRKRGKMTETSIKPLIVNTIGRNSVKQSTNYRVKIARNQKKEGRQYRVKKRRRQGGARTRQESGTTNTQSREEDKNTLVMQKQDKSNMIISIQHKLPPIPAIKNTVETPNLFENLNVPAKNNLGSSLPLPLRTTDFASADFAQFDAQFGGSPQSRIPTTRRIETVSYPNTGFNTYSKYPQFQHPRTSPPPVESYRSRSLFRGHPATGVDMETGAYSITIRL